MGDNFLKEGLIHLQVGAASPKFLGDGGIYSNTNTLEKKDHPISIRGLNYSKQKALDLFSFMKCNTHLDYKYCHYDPDLRDKEGFSDKPMRHKLSSTTMMLE
ncbi:MAG: hypothetical protein CM15mP104_1870 [Gammaproteobacteria bacterium]|nr:MAG: hypothetical protein CM15mP104_1870 [Gammaproteobacteria bacterium]